jgi:hypothetical protein
VLVNADFDGKEYLRCRVIINTVRIFFTEESNIGMQINMYCNASTVQIKSLQTIGRAENPPDSAVHGDGSAADTFASCIAIYSDEPHVNERRSRSNAIVRTWIEKTPFHVIGRGRRRALTQAGLVRNRKQRPFSILTLGGQVARIESALEWRREQKALSEEIAVG